MIDQGTELTAEELMHLAMHAIGQKTPDKAIALLKRLLNLEPNNGKAHYLLGAVHAEIGMYDQAAEEMARALDLEAELHTARFQLGLLKITSGQVEAAEQIWEGLNDLGDQDPLYQFKTGMLHLVNDEFTLCVDALKAGIALNTFNEDLNNDMRRVMQDARQAAAPAPDVNGPGTANGRQILLSAYENRNGADE